MPLLEMMFNAKPNPDQVFFTNVNSYNTTRKCICFEDSVAGVQATNSKYMVEISEFEEDITRS
jgi:beta-phosphoglucomutase-like phosphatase (HAD superfamily)